MANRATNHDEGSGLPPTPTIATTADGASNYDEGFGLPPAPTIPPEFAREWLDLEHPEMASVVETALLARQHFLAVQNNHILFQLENVLRATSRIQSRRSSISSAAASTEGGDDASIAPIPGDQVQEAFDELRAGELRGILKAIHNPFVTVNNKKLYVQRTINANTDARTFIEHVTQVIKEKQANPDGQETDVAEHHEKLLGYLDNLTPDLKTDLYIELNKEKKKSDPKGKPKPKPKGKGKGKAKHVESPIFVNTDDSDHRSTTSHQPRHDRAGGSSRAGPSTAVTEKQPASARPSRHNSNQSDERPRRYPSRQTSGSSRAGGGQSQQSQLSVTSVQARRSKQRTRFVIADSEDEGDSPQG